MNHQVIFLNGRGILKAFPVLCLTAGLLAALEACGGGSVASDGNSPTPLATVPATVAIDAAVPAPGTGAVARILSPVGSAVPGQTVPIPGISGQETFVAAVGTSGDILLAGLPTTGTITLSVDSTTLALVRLAVGPIPTGATPAQVNAAIRATAAFPDLLAAVAGALAGGGSPVKAAPVLQALGQVLGQLGPAPAALGPVQEAMLAQPTVPGGTSGQAPYRMVGAGPFAVAIASANGDGSVEVTNSFPIQWAVRGYTADGHDTPIPATPLAPAGDIALVAQELSVKGLAANLFFDATPEAVSVPGIANGFNLRLYQSSVARTANVNALEMKIFTVALGWLGVNLDESCAGALVTTVLGPNTANWVAQPSAELAYQNLHDYFSDSGNWKEIFTTGKTCLGFDNSKGEFAQAMADLLDGLCKFYTTMTVGELGNAIDSGFLGVQFADVLLYWNADYQVGVCENASGALEDCATLFALGPTAPKVPLPGSLPLILQAFNTDTGTAKPVVVPTGLQWTSSDPAVAQVDANGVVTGIKAGVATITVLDPFTEVKTTLLVTVGCSIPEGTSVCGTFTAGGQGCQDGTLSFIFHTDGTVTFQSQDSADSYGTTGTLTLNGMTVSGTISGGGWIDGTQYTGTVSFDQNCAVLITGTWGNAGCGGTFSGSSLTCN